MTQQNGRPGGNPEWGYRLNFWPSPGEVQHDFCGTNDIAGATCPNCQKPFLRLLSLNAADERLNIDPARNPVVHLIYCWTCSVPFGEFCYKVAAGGSIEILRVSSKYEYEFGPAGPYDGYAGVFPHQRVSLQPFTPYEQQHLKRQFLSDSPEGREPPYEGHQVGGYPLIDNPSETTCPVCSTDMPLLAVICDDATGNEPFGVSPLNSFTANGGVQMVFHFCRSCSVVSSYHSCD